jgi:MFS family permease
MTKDARRVQRVYLVLLLLHTLAASFIWGVNTLFLLDAGLSNTEAFAANACFTAGLVLFEIPTGVMADVRGRRLSYLLGTLILMLSTLAYLALWARPSPFWAWAVASALLGLGFTFFSGAVQAWLVDALKASGFTGSLDSVFAKGEIVEGVAMLSGSVAGGYVAQLSNLGVPYVMRAVALAVSLALAWYLMHDLGFSPKHTGSLWQEATETVKGGLKYGLRNPPARWVMLASAFADGVSMYGFYAMQPYLLELYGDPGAYGIAGLAAAIVGGAQIGGGLLLPRMARVVRRRTSLLIAAAGASTLALLLIGLFPAFWIATSLLVAWGLIFALVMPVRQAYLNELIPSEQRATVLSFDSLIGSAGGVATQPALGRVADAWGYPASDAWSSVIQLLAVPLLALARRQNSAADRIEASSLQGFKDRQLN